ncbi:hypothetical protein CEXT_722451 [Caerostris extrusa]|uniref:Uncharacterized protein n=1 Tax=Caerostris extrusa TaxID=172846 RepID=A0AAV4TRX6_CAEEX|nr:hypothetical protein CEXT_722451 [Caerostris extrusa]
MEQLNKGRGGFSPLFPEVKRNKGFRRFPSEPNNLTGHGTIAAYQARFFDSDSSCGHSFEDSPVDEAEYLGNGSGGGARCLGRAL